MIIAANNIDHSLQYLRFNSEGLNNIYTAEYNINAATIATYTISVKCIKYKNKQSIIELNRTNEMISSNTVTNHATDLALACGRIVYPVEIILNEQAQIIGINNHKTIINRWLKESPLITGYYTGEAAENYIKQTEETVMNVDAIIKALQADFFIAAYFTPLYTNIRDGFAFKENKLYHISGTISMAMQQKATVIEDDSTLFRVDITGESQLAGNKEIAIQGKYIVKRKLYTIEHIDFTWITVLKDETQVNNIKITSLN